jgi:hypothetical protein
MFGRKQFWLIEVLTSHLSGRTEESNEKAFRIASVLTDSNRALPKYKSRALFLHKVI